MFKKVLLFLLLIPIVSQSQPSSQNRWIDSIMNNLSLEDKITQLDFIRIDAADEDLSFPKAKELLEKSAFGGVIFSGYGPVAIAKMTKELQNISSIPLFIKARMHEKNRVLLDSTWELPAPAILGAAQDDSLLKQLGVQIARQLSIAGVNMTDYPIFDQQSDSSRSNIFSDRSLIQSKKLNFFLSGLKEENIITDRTDTLQTVESFSALRKKKKLIKKNKGLSTTLDAQVRKVLAQKFAAGLIIPKEINTDNLILRMHSPAFSALSQSIAESAVTVVKDNNNLVPIRTLDDRRFILISVGTEGEPFSERLEKHIPFEHYTIHPNDHSLSVVTAPNDIVVVAVFRQTDHQQLSELFKGLHHPNIIVCDFSLNGDLVNDPSISTFIEGYEDTPLMQSVVADVIFGAIPARGRLPVSLSSAAMAGSGVDTDFIGSLGFAVPEMEGVSGNTLSAIDTIAEEAILNRATPGCYVLVARNGKIIYDKAFGWFTYDKVKPVTDKTIYDLASVTKVTSTLQAFMFLYEKGYFDLDKKISVYLPELVGSNKENLILSDILTHQAGLLAFLPFWQQTMKDSTYLPGFYSSAQDSIYSLQVASELFTKPSMRDSLWQWIIRAPLRVKTSHIPYTYLYSDMGFYILQHLCEKYLNQPIEDFMAQNFYEPLGAATTGYLPLRKFDSSLIAPTENDKVFRKTQILGTVHDQGSAMMGGVAGHAGVFSDGIDLAKLGQMLLQKGYYGGIRYFKPETVDFFGTRYYEQSHRGLGWNKPVQNEWVSATSMTASPATFGHAGYTGTGIWMDPEFNLLYIFLSNRIYPDADNNKLIDENFRSRVEDVIYQAIFDFCRNPAF